MPMQNDTLQSKGVYSLLSKALNPFLNGKVDRLGTLIIAEFADCEKIPANRYELEELMLEAAKILQVTIVEKVFHEFNPYGLSGVLVLAESHFSIHTWPEYNCVAVDLFACGKMNWGEGINFLAKKLMCKSKAVVEIPRGLGVK